MGKELVYKKQNLQVFDKQPQDDESARRQRERDIERAKIADKETDREVKLPRIAAEEAKERARIAANEVKIAADR